MSQSITIPTRMTDSGWPKRSGKWDEKQSRFEQISQRLWDIRSMFEIARRELPRPDVLVNNAGVTGWTDLF
jgi:NAD(P)-dependent dehydrogenase (short-subunit alcohol dehydrogenase family)